MVYYSQLKGACIFDSKKECIGKIEDFVFLDGKEYAEITDLVYLDDEKVKKKIAWDYIKEIKEKKKAVDIMLNSPADELTPFFVAKKDPLVGGILDKQVVDVNGVKIVRVNDVILGKVKNGLSIVAVAVGAKSFLSRLGMRKFADLSTKENVIPWRSIERIEQEFHDIHLKVQKDKIADLHPEDIADIMEDLSHSERITIFNSLNKRKAAKTLIEAEENVQDSMLRSFKIKKIKDLLENIPCDQAADIISLMPKVRQKEILDSMKKDTSRKIERILDYIPESVGSIMKTDVIAIPKEFSAQKTISYLRKLKPISEKLYHLYVVDRSNKLLGILSIRALLIASPRARISTFMNHKVIFVRDNSPKEHAARLMARYDLFVLPVLDKDGALKGIVKADDILDEYIPEKLQREKFLPLKLRR